MSDSPLPRQRQSPSRVPSHPRTLRLPVELNDAVVRAAREAGMTQNNWITAVLARELGMKRYDTLHTDRQRTRT